jgi:transcriptional regulator with GAF, ATPase, and Fis domain
MAWSMKSDRELIALTRAKFSVDKIARKMEASPKTILKAARRLGLQLPARRKAKVLST